jgi:hypothetical protein
VAWVASFAKLVPLVESWEVSVERAVSQRVPGCEMWGKGVLNGYGWKCWEMTGPERVVWSERNK